MELLLDAENGGIGPLAVDGKPLVLAGPSFTLWRCPTDNECIKGQGDWARKNPWKAYGRWCRAGLDVVEEDRVAFSFKPLRGGAASVETRSLFRPAGPDLGATIVKEKGEYGFTREIFKDASPEDRAKAWPAIEHRASYRLEPTGALLCRHVFVVPKAFDDLPRLGVRMTLAPSLENLTWFGPGPLESYPDRREGSIVGTFASTVADQFFPYIVPQEHGHHVDARWLTLADARGRGLQFQAEGANFGFNATHMPDEVLWPAKHVSELKPEENVTLYLDAAHRGLGTGSCGPDTRPAYRIRPGAYRLAYWVFPV